MRLRSLRLLYLIVRENVPCIVETSVEMCIRDRYAARRFSGNGFFSAALTDPYQKVSMDGTDIVVVMSVSYTHLDVYKRQQW